MTTDDRGGRAGDSAVVTRAGADWLASASPFPRSVLALWRARPQAPSALPCGTAFDVVSLPPVLGRAVLEQLWTPRAGAPGASGPAAVVRGRTLLFAAPGTAARLPSLLAWGQWAALSAPSALPDPPGAAPLCFGPGDAVTIPPLRMPPAGPRPGPRWLLAPQVRHPWLPGARALLRACVRAGARPGAGGEERPGAVPAPGYRFSITPDRMLKSSCQAPLAQLVRAADS
ncbi:bifunctional DNA primase/polymerase [Streptomyces polyrhachis]|uniref:Bifunctional DNA primase/polymerase n=1 Tax=Streptomyces polyrhachis TaxID=1282885 RepID=A0ABW2GCX6_9ACTN